MPISAPPRLLATKTQRPKLPPWLVRRERLFALLDAARQRTLTVIKAAAGFGKTSVALAWADHLAQQGQRVAWVSLDPEDDEPGRFLLYVAQALRSACPEIDVQVLGLIDEVSLIRPLDVVRLLINALAGIEQDIFLFIDDYHLLRHADVAACTAYLLRHAPLQLHIVLTTRTEPDLPLVRLRGRSQLVEIEAGALRFDLDETRRFLELEATGGSGEAAALQEKTEGWPVMLRIVATTAQQSGQGLPGYIRQLSARHRPIRSHLIDMLNGLPQEVVSLLLKTSILESLCAGLCRAVADAPEAVFEQVASRQLLLTPLDADGLWFRCHPLLRGFLQQRLETEMPEAVRDLHRRAHAWYAGEQRWTDAIRHAIAVGDAAEAVVWIERCAMALLKRGELLALAAWERTVPPELMRRQVKARLAIAWGMALAMRFDEAWHYATEIEKEIGEADPSAREAIGCECQTIRAVALALRDDTEAALELAEDSLRRRSSGRWTTAVAVNVAMLGWWKRGELERCHALPWIASRGEDVGRNVVATVYRLCLLGMIDYEQLHCAAAARHYREALQVASDHVGPNSAAAAQPAALLAQWHYEQGRLDEAAAMLADRLPTIDAVCMLECVLRAYTVLVRIAAHRGLRDRAQELLDQADQLARSRRWARLQTMALRERTRLALLDGDVAAAEAHLRRLRGVAAEVAGTSAALQTAVEDDLDVSDGLLSIAKAASDLASDQFNRLGARARLRDSKRMELEGAIGLAGAKAGPELGSPDLEPLRLALRLVARSGQIQVLCDGLLPARRNVPGMLRLIDLTAEAACVAEMAKRVDQELARFGTTEPNPAEARTGISRLSPREQNILCLLSEGDSNKDIARKLGVSPETIKTHVRRIFTKMSVRNREQAISGYFRNLR